MRIRHSSTTPTVKPPSHSHLHPTYDSCSWTTSIPNTMSPSYCKKRTRVEETPTSSRYGSAAALMNNGPFRDNIRQFLKECAEPTKHCSVAGFPTWRSSFVSDTNSVIFSLYTVEEDVRKSDRPFCDNCKCVGWSHHYVSKRRYHLIIPRQGKWSEPQGEDTFEVNTHLLHAMIHCNGFGHLLCINAKGHPESSISADEIMNLWDHICSVLHVRKITVQDLAKKGTMDLRLLYGATYGRSWFAKWGYKFHRGSFGVTKDEYDRAVQVLCSLDLDSIVQDLSDSSLRSKEIQHIITTFREASGDDHNTSVLTISDLLQSMLAVAYNDNKQQLLHEDKTKSRRGGSTTTTTCSSMMMTSDHKVGLSSLLNSSESRSRWPERRLEHAVKVIANTLKNHKSTNSSSSSMSRQELRDAARLYIGDTGLIDFVIKNIDNTVVGDLIIRRRMKPRAKTLEFSVEDAAAGEKQRRSSLDDTQEDSDSDSEKDKYVLCLYENVLGGYSGSHPVSLATQIILDSKHFIKEWEFQDDEVSVMCRMMPSYEELVTKLTRLLPPPELVVVVPGGGGGGGGIMVEEELKLAVQRALRDTYFIADKFVVKEVRVSNLERRSEVVVRGTGLDLTTEMRYEGGLDDWMVNCVCGARDDDGERMVECDVCGVWHHTFCSSIDDEEDVPPKFICGRCNQHAPDKQLNI